MTEIDGGLKRLKIDTYAAADYLTALGAHEQAEAVKRLWRAHVSLRETTSRLWYDNVKLRNAK